MLQIIALMQFLLGRFAVMDNIIWISGMPRSGTTWLSQIFASSPDVRLKFCPLFSYEFKNALNEKSSAEEWRNLFTQAYETKSDYLDQEYLREKGLVPTFTLKNDEPSNLVIKSTRFHNLIPCVLALHPDIQFVHIIRDPRATIYSWLSNHYEFPKGADVKKHWESGECRKGGYGEFWGFTDWMNTSHQALELEAKYPERFKVIRYEDLFAQPQLVVSNLFNFLNLKFHQQTDDFILLSQSKHDANKRSVFKAPNKASNWQGKLDPDINKSILESVQCSALSHFLDEDNRQAGNE